MNKQTVRGVDAPALSEERIAEYLQENPDFFERQGVLLTKLKLSHQRAATTSSRPRSIAWRAA